jgi:hypothetical protein
MAVKIVFIIAALMFVFGSPLVSNAQSRDGGPGMYHGAPYGHYCPGPGWGPYGVRKPVRTVEEAKEVLEKYFSASGKAVQVGKIEQKRGYFEAEILDSDGKLVDKAIVDRRTGRIRSIY